MATTDMKLYASVGVLAVLGGALYLTTQKQKAEASAYSFETKQAELPKLQVSDDQSSKVTKIAISKPKSGEVAALDVELVKKGDEWRLSKPGNDKSHMLHKHDF